MDVFACVGACWCGRMCARRGRGRGAADVMIGLVAYGQHAAGRCAAAALAADGTRRRAVVVGCAGQQDVSVRERAMRRGGGETMRRVWLLLVVVVVRRVADCWMCLRVLVRVVVRTDARGAAGGGGRRTS